MTLKWIAVLLTLTLTATAQTQQLKGSNYYASVKQHNLAKLWRADSLTTGNSDDKIPFPEPLGLIGDNFQRFYIHYTSVVKSRKNPYLYLVHGKTKVKDNICGFSGTITVSSATIYKKTFKTGYKQGYILCAVKLFEDSTETFSGLFIGKLKSYFFIDKKGRIQYNALRFESDGFNNNQCETIWTSYKTNKTRKCNWGDFRIPGSKELDKGAGDFLVKDKYIAEGWQNYTEAYSGNGPEAEKALIVEKEKWWE